MANSADPDQRAPPTLFAKDITTQQAKNKGPIWAPKGLRYGALLGSPHRTQIESATGIYMGPLLATIWVPHGIYLGTTLDLYGQTQIGPIWANTDRAMMGKHR